MKYVMYSIIAILAVTVVILAFVVANKPPREDSPALASEASPSPPREILFNPSPEVEEDPESPFLIEEEEEEEVEDLPLGVRRIGQTMYAIDSVNVREGPSTDFERIGRLSYGEEVFVIGQDEERNWYYIEYGDVAGYVSNNFISETEPPRQTAPEETTPEQPAETQPVDGQ